MAEIRDYSTAPDPQTAARWPEGMAMSAVNDTGRVDEGIIARWYQDTRGDLLSTGSADAYVVTPERDFSDVTSGYDGLQLVFEANFTNTGSATLAAGAITATTIKNNDGGGDLVGGEIQSGSKIAVIHNGTNWLLMQTSTNSSAVTSTGSTEPRLLEDRFTDVRSAKDFGIDGVGDQSVEIADWLSKSDTALWHGGTYELTGVSAEDVDIIGQGNPTLQSLAGNETFQLNKNVILERVTIDGQSDTVNKLQVGGDPGTTPEKITVQHSQMINCPVNSARLSVEAEQVHYLFNRSDGSKALNTSDMWTGGVVTIMGGQYLGIPGEGLIIDPAGVDDPEWHGVVHVGNLYEMAAGGEKGFGVARAIGGVSVGNIFKGAAGVTEELEHGEDMAEKWGFFGSVYDTNGAPEAIDWSLGGDAAYTHPDRQPKNIAYSATAIFCGGTAKAYEFQGSVSEGEFEKITIDGAHIDSPTVVADMRLKDGAVINTVSYDPQSPVTVITSQFVATSGRDSPNAHDIIVTDNHYIRPTFIRANVGTCFDPNKLLWKYTFANELTFPTAPAGGLGNSATVSQGGSLGGGTQTFPLSVAADGIAGCKYFRSTAGASTMTTRFDIDFDAQLEDIQNGDCISLQIMCRSSVDDRGSIRIRFPNAGPSDSLLNLATTADWQVLGLTKRIDETADMFATGTIECDIFPGTNLLDGETFDIAWIKISRVSAV